MGKNGRIFFDRPKPTVGCSASGRRSMYYIYLYYISAYIQHDGGVSLENSIRSCACTVSTWTSVRNYSYERKSKEKKKTGIIVGSRSGDWIKTHNKIMIIQDKGTIPRR
jgi:hypothetical protein